MAEKTRPELDWGDEEVSRVREDSESGEEDSEVSKSEEGLCKVEDPTCEACQ